MENKNSLNKEKDNSAFKAVNALNKASVKLNII